MKAYFVSGEDGIPAKKGENPGKMGGPGFSKGELGISVLGVSAHFVVNLTPWGW